MTRLAAAGWIAIVALAALGCGRTPPGREYELRGQILEVRSDRDEVVIKHEDIRNFMPGMTMPFKVRPASLLAGRKPGELVSATLVVEEVDAYLTTLTRTGEAPLPESVATAVTPATLQPGDAVPDAALVDQDGAPAFLSSVAGHPVALTFIYTRCPIPDFCPLMDRNFQAIQTAIRQTPALANARLLTITLDPAYDTPPVLKAYAQKLGADPAIWSFLTGEPAELAKFGERFGLYIEHDATSSINVIHNLRTAVIDPAGRIVTIHNGNAWTVSELLADLTKAAAASAN